MLSLLFIPLIFYSFFNFLYGIKAKKEYLGYHILNLVYFFIYGLSGFYSYFDYKRNSYLYTLFIREDSFYLLSAILILISYYFSLKAYKYFFNNNSRLFRVNISEYNILVSSHIAFVLCIIFIFIYTKQYGGFQNALSFAAAIRSGYGEVEDESKLTFVKYLMPIGVFPFLTYGYKFFRKPNIPYFFMWILSFLVIFFAFVLMSGRTRIVMYLLAMILLIIYSKENYKFKISQVFKFSPIILLAVFFVVQGKNIFSSLGALINGEKLTDVVNSNEKKEGILDAFLGYFSHRTYSLEISLIDFLKTNDLVFFKDTFYIPLYLIPERLTGIKKPDSISYHNTEVLTGIYDSTIPPGILAYGSYSLWLPGIFISALLFGGVFGILDNYFRSNAEKRYMLILLMPTILVWGLYGSTGDFRIITNGMIYIFVFLLILLFSKFIVGKSNA